MGYTSLLLAALAATSSFVDAQSSVSSAAASLPTVDLGYAVHRPTLNSSGYPSYKFSNIRYAAPPTGHRRFAAPIPPISINRTVNDGSRGAICPQANPAWVLTAVAFLSGTPVANLTQASNSSSVGLSSIPPPANGTSEDCLFLDVTVPTSIFNSSYARAQRNETGASGGNSTAGAPVLVWIYGGGYTAGSKNNDPRGLLARARDDGQDGLIFVSMNYRLGAYGWLSGPSFQQNGTANAGLYDQRLALEWIQANIHLFGGDRHQVTVMGESAGGGSIMHQITAYGGLKGRVPFQRAISQSPGFLPLPSNNLQETIYATTLAYATLISGRQISDLQGLRSLNDTELYLTNAAVVGLSTYGSFTYGPAVDGNFVPKLPGELLLHGQFDKNVSVMLGHNSNEGILFTSPFIQNETALVAYLSYSLPAATNATITYITKVLYPPVYNGTYGYNSVTSRLSLILSEFSFTCNTRYLNLAYQNQTYNYYFSVPPGIHGSDVPYTFFDGDSSSINATVAASFQDYLTSFAMNGSPNEPGVPFFPLYGANSSTQTINITNFGTQLTDTAANSRCSYWQKALYY